jgi:hypothetical protein
MNTQQQIAELIAGYCICNSQDAEATKYDFPNLFSRKVEDVNKWLKEYHPGLATTGELPATAIDLEHFLDYVGLNYTPVRFTDGVLWDLDDSEAPMSSEEVIQDYKEQFGSTPVAPKEEGEPAPVPQWVSVEDRLPYKDGNSEIFCLVWDTYEGHAIVRPYNEYHKCWDGEDADDFYTDATDGNISHWMPLPSTPVGAAPKEPGE